MWSLQRKKNLKRPWFCAQSIGVANLAMVSVRTTGKAIKEANV